MSDMLSKRLGSVRVRRYVAFPTNSISRWLNRAEPTVSDRLQSVTGNQERACAGGDLDRRKIGSDQNRGDIHDISPNSAADSLDCAELRTQHLRYSFAKYNAYIECFIPSCKEVRRRSALARMLASIDDLPAQLCAATYGQTTKEEEKAVPRPRRGPTRSLFPRYARCLHKSRPKRGASNRGAARISMVEASGDIGNRGLDRSCCHCIHTSLQVALGCRRHPCDRQQYWRDG